MLKKISLSVPLILALVFPAACSTPYTQRDVPVVEGSGELPTQAEPPPNIGEMPESPGPTQSLPGNERSAPAAERPAAVLALLESAQRLQDQKDYAAAATALERAIRIAPRDAGLYLQLASLRVLQGRVSQAQQLCRKAVALASDDLTIKYRCQAIFNAQAYHSSGD